jgi:uncharacterized protein (TIGR02001 family)
MKNISCLLNRHVLAALCATPLLLSANAFADEMPAAEAAPAAAVEAAAPAAPAEPAPDFTLSFNLGLYSEYVFRGVALTDGPALQGGIDLGHKSGFYVGTWWSNVDKEFTGHGDGYSGGNHLETDWYVGYAHTFDSGFGVNVLGNYYYYPDRERAYSYVAQPGPSDGDKQDSFEASIALSYKWFTYTYYNVLTDYYGAAASGTKDGTSDTSNADYHELKVNYTLPIADLNFVAKVGHQHTPNLTGSASDVLIGLNRNFSLPSGGKPIEGFNAGAYYTDTFDVDNEAFYVSNTLRDTNHERIWFFVKRTW